MTDPKVFTCANRLAFQQVEPEWTKTNKGNLCPMTHRHFFVQTSVEMLVT